jgi:hypothetical protein
LVLLIALISLPLAVQPVIVPHRHLRRVGKELISL